MNGPVIEVNVPATGPDQCWPERHRQVTPMIGDSHWDRTADEGRSPVARAVMRSSPLLSVVENNPTPWRILRAEGGPTRIHYRRVSKKTKNKKNATGSPAHLTANWSIVKCVIRSGQKRGSSRNPDSIKMGRDARIPLYLQKRESGLIMTLCLLIIWFPIRCHRRSNWHGFFHFCSPTNIIS